jgi:sulfoxide reductase heme-binding subunit YedZ
MRVPWRDRRGEFLKFKAAVLACTPIPGLVWAFWWIHGDLSGQPVNDVIHGIGSWTVRWLMLSLAITPFARIVEWPRLLTVRRMVGVTALAYASVHLLLYIVDQKFQLLTVVSEIVRRFYLTIGFVALSGLIALGVTSTDAAMKRMGKRWKQLHRLVYPIGVLALLHFFIQTKANVGEPVFVSGLFAWMMLWRLLPMARRTAVLTFFALVPVSAVVTAAIEFAWYGIATKIDPFRILNANWSERFFPRPAHEVAAVALVVAIVVTGRRLLSRRAMPRPAARVSPAEANSP